MVEKALQEKEEENLSLHRQLKQCEVRWSQYEEKMRCMEVTWQKQLISLQVRFAFVWFELAFMVPHCFFSCYDRHIDIFKEAPATQALFKSLSLVGT